MLFAFFLLLLAKNQGSITEYGRLLNINTIYAMLTSVAIMPFINKFWLKYDFFSVIKNLSLYFIIISCIFSLVFYNFLPIYQLCIIVTGSYIFVFTNILIQYFQSNESLYFQVPIIVFLINIFCILIFYFARDTVDIIVIYFLPYLIILFFLPSFYKKIKTVNNKVICNFVDTYNFLKKIYGWGLIISLSWPIAFLFIREIYSEKDLYAWENYEFALRVSLSVIGLASALIINYNLHYVKGKLFEKTKKLLSKSLVPSYVLLIIGYTFLFIYLKGFGLVNLIILFTAYLMKLIMFSMSYPLLNLFKAREIAIIELISSILLVTLIFINLNVSISIFLTTFFSIISVSIIWKRASVSK